MAVIYREDFKKDLSINPREAVAYVDSRNSDSYLIEMYNYTCKYIRESTSLKNVKKELHLAKNINDIYKNKSDGYWFIVDKSNRVIELYKKYISVGYIMNSINVEKIFILTCTPNVPRIVPRIINKSNGACLHDNLMSEIFSATEKVRNRKKINNYLDMNSNELIKNI